MKIKNSVFLYAVVVFSLVLSACGTGLPQPGATDVSQKVLPREIVFSGIVEQINGNQWIVSGQAFTVDPAAAMDSNIAIGDIVKVEGTVSADGSVVALKVESSTVTDDNANGANTNGDVSDGNVNANGNVNSNDDNSNSGNSNGTDDNSNGAADDANEVFGLVEALTPDSITVGGITYQLAGFTEFKDAIAVGDQVKLHVILNADGTFTIREIEKSDSPGGDDNSNDANGNDANGNDDNGNDDNSNGGNSNDNGSGGNSNGDDSGGGGGDNGNDDGDNGNDD